MDWRWPSSADRNISTGGCRHRWPREVEQVDRDGWGNANRNRKSRWTAFRLVQQRALRPSIQLTCTTWRYGFSTNMAWLPWWHCCQVLATVKTTVKPLPVQVDIWRPRVKSTQAMPSRITSRSPFSSPSTVSIRLHDAVQQRPPPVQGQQPRVSFSVAPRVPERLEVKGRQQVLSHNAAAAPDPGCGTSNTLGTELRYKACVCVCVCDCVCVCVCMCRCRFEFKFKFQFHIKIENKFKIKKQV